MAVDTGSVLDRLRAVSDVEAKRPAGSHRTHPRLATICVHAIAVSSAIHTGGVVARALITKCSESVLDCDQTIYPIVAGRPARFDLPDVCLAPVRPGAVAVAKTAVAAFVVAGTATGAGDVRGVLNLLGAVVKLVA